MAINKDISGRIKDLLRDHPEGLSITNIVKALPINRNTASRYLDTLLVSGQVEMHNFGMAKIFSLSKRLPVSSVLAISSEYVLQVDRSLRVIFLNAPFLDLLGLAEKDVAGKKIDYTKIPVFFEDTYPRLLCWINDGLSGVKRRGELTLAAKDLIFTCRIDPAVFSEGQKGVSVIFEDISARKLDEKRIRESEERYRKLVEISPDAIILHRAGIIFYANPAAIRLIGASYAGEILGKNILDYVQPKYVAAVRDNIHDDLKGKSTPPIEVGMIRVDGTPIMIEGRGVQMFIDDEPAVQVVMRDVTERKRIEDELLFLKISVDSAYDEVFWMDFKANMLYVNDAACRTTGYSREELYAMKIFALDPNFTLEEWELSIGDLRTNKTQFFQTRHRCKDGVILDVEIRSVYVVRDEKEYAFYFVRDITERKRIEEALRESENRYRSLAEVLQDMIFVIDREDRVVYINQQAADFLQIPADSVIGTPRSSIFPPHISNRQYEALQQVFATGQTVRSEGPMTIGEDIRWFVHTLVPIPDANGRTASVLGVSRDITKHIAAERKRGQNEGREQSIAAEYSMDIIR